MTDSTPATAAGELPESMGWVPGFATEDDDEPTTTAGACGALLALDHGDWAEENMNACELPAGHEPPHRQRFPAQHRFPAYVVEWADEAWWSE